MSDFLDFVSQRRVSNSRGGTRGGLRREQQTFITGRISVCKMYTAHMRNERIANYRGMPSYSTVTKFYRRF